jgi:hypothetical protein
MSVTIKLAGWIRLPGHLWQLVVEADSEDTAWCLLREHVDRIGAKLIDRCVVAFGIDSRDRRRIIKQPRKF